MEGPQKEGVEYRDIPGFPNYKIGSDCTIWSAWGRGGSCFRVNSTWRLLKSTKTKRHYLIVIIRNTVGIRKCKFLHQLMLESFVGPCPIGMEACHNNGIPWDNRIDNLRWDTRKNNHADKIKHGTAQRGVNHGAAKLTERQVYEIRRLSAEGWSLSAIAKIHNVSDTAISYIIKRRNWKHI